MIMKKDDCVEFMWDDLCMASKYLLIKYNLSNKTIQISSQQTQCNILLISNKSPVSETTPRNLEQRKIL